MRARHWAVSVSSSLSLTNVSPRRTPDPVVPDENYTGIPYDPKYAIERKGKLNSTPYPYHEYEKRYAYLKNAQRYKKQEQIAAGQLDPDGQMDLSKSVDKHGLCTDMCPELERVRRIVQKDVAGPEFTKETARGPRSARQPDERRMIAAFHRSSAGDDLTLMSDLRTPKALLVSRPCDTSWTWTKRLRIP